MFCVYLVDTSSVALCGVHLLSGHQENIIDCSQPQSPVTARLKFKGKLSNGEKLDSVSRMKEKSISFISNIKAVKAVTRKGFCRSP